MPKMLFRRGLSKKNSTRVLKLNPPLSIQNLRIFPGGFILYNIKKNPRRTAFKINLFLNTFWTVSLLITEKKLKIFACFARRGWGPKKIPRFAREVLFFTKSPKNSPALRAGGFILYQIQKISLRFARGSFIHLNTGPFPPNNSKKP